MNKMSKCTMVSLVALISACQTFPSVAIADNASAKAEVKPVESVKPAEPRTPATEVARSEPKAESKASAEPVSMITPMMERQQTIRATGYAVISTQNHKNGAQQRLMAIRASKLDAYRALTEQVYGQQLDATTTVAEMAKALEKAAGAQVASLIDWTPDPVISKIVLSWPVRVSADRAKGLGLLPDADFASIIDEYLSENPRKT